jgi:hypothetical protein
MSKTSIISYMRDMFLLCAYTDWSDETKRTRPGQAFTVESMPTPTTWLADEAQKKAERLYDTIEQMWDASPVGLLDRFARSTGHRPEHIYRDWGHDAVRTALGMGVRWEDYYLPLSYGGTEYSVKHILISGLGGWEGAEPPPINYVATSEPRILDRDQACAIAMGWHRSMDDPIYAFSSTGCIQSETHRLDVLSNLMSDIRYTLDRWDQLHPKNETADTNTQQDIQDLADLLVYVTTVPIREV